jgi:hypothetical protein
MDFADQLKTLAAKIPKLCDLLQTEEATKNALVMPFISALGYDVFDPTEVTPEFVADVGIKKGEKVDYAILKDGRIVMLFECKHCGGDLSIKHASQLFRYFTTTTAKIGVLTNGVVYRFFTDLDAPNKMDEKPFLEVNMLDLNETVVSELKKLTKPAFNLDELMTTAGDLKYTREIKKLLAEQLDDPSPEFVKFCASKVFEGQLTQNRRDYFAGIVRRSFGQLVNDRINERLKSAMSDGAVTSEEIEEMSGGSIDADNLIDTTAEEMEGFYAVKSLLRDVVDLKRVISRDTKSYFGILLDNNNRKPIARLYFNGSRKYIGLFDEQRKERKIAIESLDDIYEHGDEIRRVFAFYERERGGSSVDAPTEE